MDQETYTCGLCENNVQTVMDLQKYFLHLIFIHHSNSLCQYLEINPQESKTHKCSQCQKQCHGHQAYLVHYFMGHEKQFLLDLQAKEVQKKKSSEADDQKRLFFIHAILFISIFFSLFYFISFFLQVSNMSIFLPQCGGFKYSYQSQA